MGFFELSGNYTHNLDPKGRATIPAAFREAFAEGFAVGLNNDFNAIALYPPEKWNEIGEKLSRIPDADAKGMAYVRLIKAFSFPGQTLDGQGRVLIPQALRQQAGVEKAIRFVGVGRYLEIWDEDRFVRQFTAARENAENLMAYVTDRYFGNGT
jgi:MraZ protein